MTVDIGTSGWSYPHWVPALYDPRLPRARWLDAYAAEFTTVELNASFYHWPKDSTFVAWRNRLPDGFVMTVKAPRGLTHARRLRTPEVWSERIDRGMRELGANAGPLLVQLHPDHERDDDRLDAFLDVLPEWLTVAVEFRHPSWHRPEVFALLESHGASYVVMSGARLPCVLRATARLVYLRLHGPDPETRYGGSYCRVELRCWAERIQEWSAGGHDVLAYFNNDGAGNAVRNARDLRALLTGG